MMLCYFVQRFCRNRMWLASRVSPIEAPRVQQAGSGGRSSILPGGSALLSHESFAGDRGVSRRSKRSRSAAREHASSANGQERRASSLSRTRARHDFRKFFRNFFGRDKPASRAALRLTIVARKAPSHHDPYIAETLEKKGLEMYKTNIVSKCIVRFEVYESKSVCRFHERKHIEFYLIFKKKDHFLETSSSKC